MRGRLAGLALELWFPATILVIWWFASARWNSPYFPSLEVILDTFVSTWFSDRFRIEVLPTIMRFGVGYLIAIAAGVGFGLIFGLSRTLRLMFEPVLDFFRAMPKTALLPVFIVVIGVGESMKIGIVAFGATWPVLLNTIDGVRGVEPTYIEMSRVYRLGRWSRIFRVILPAAGPQIFAGARLALAIALILVLVAEMLASTNGVGYVILQSQQTFAIPEMWAGLIILGMIGYAVNLLFVLCEGRMLAWHRGWRAAMLGRPSDASGPRGGRRRRYGTSDPSTRSGQGRAVTPPASTESS